MVRIFNTIAMKGGVTKSTQNFTLAHLLATDSHEKIRRYDHQREAKKVLVIDLDLTPNLSRILLKDRYEDIVETKSVVQAIKDGDATNHIVDTENPNLKILPGTTENSLFDTIYAEDYVGKKDAEKMLSNALKKAQEKYQFDFILIDNCPVLNRLTIQSLNIDLDCLNEVIVPLQLDAFSNFALSDISSAINGIQDSNDNLILKKVVPILVNSSSSLDKKIIQDLKDSPYGDFVTETIIRNKNEMKIILDSGFSEHYSNERKALSMYYDLLNELLEEE